MCVCALPTHWDRYRTALPFVCSLSACGVECCSCAPVHLRECGTTAVCVCAPLCRSVCVGGVVCTRGEVWRGVAWCVVCCVGDSASHLPPSICQSMLTSLLPWTTDHRVPPLHVLRAHSRSHSVTQASQHSPPTAGDHQWSNNIHTPPLEWRTKPLIRSTMSCHDESEHVNVLGHLNSRA